MDSIENSVTISEWYGRLGNNVQQVGHALAFCYHHKCSFYCPPHPQFPPFFIKFGNGTTKGASRFFYNGVDFVLDEELLISTMRPFLQQLLLPHLQVPLDTVPDRTRAILAADTTVVAHARGGDIFTTTATSHSNYIQNPLWWYLHLLETYSDMILVTEDDRNPVVNALKSNPSVTIQCGDIHSDFSVLLHARNLASGGVSTFHGSAALLSTHLIRYHSTNYNQGELLKKILTQSGVEYCETILQNYIPPGSWCNSPDQRQLMLDYTNQKIINAT